MRSLKNQIISIGLLTLLIFVINCDDRKHTNPLDPDFSGNRNTILADKVIAVDSEPSISLEDTTAGTYTFSFTGKKHQFQDGSIIVGSTGKGYLRKVISFQVTGDNRIVCQTEQARLTELFEKVKIDTSFKLEMINSNLKKSMMEPEFSLEEHRINVSGYQLYNSVINGCNLSITIAKGIITFEPDIDFGLEIDVWGINHARGIASGRLKGDFDLLVEVTKEINHEREIKLPPKFEKEVTIWVPTPAGVPVPIVIVVSLEFYAGYKVEIGAYGDIQSGFDNEFSLEVGSQYDRELTPQWRNIWKPGNKFNAHPTIWSSKVTSGIRGYIKPRLNIYIYGVVGPYFGILPYLQWNGTATNTYWDIALKAGFDGEVGFQVQVLGYDLAKYYYNFPVSEIIIAQDHGEFEIPQLYVSESNLDFGASQNSKEVNIKNVGTGLLEWTINDDSDWITVDKSSGNTKTETDKIIISVNRSGKQPGSYYGNVYVNSNAGQKTINIKMVVNENPLLNVNPTTLNFGSTANTDYIDIKNTGTGTLNWNSTGDKSWISIIPSTGTTKAETDRVRIDVSRNNLDPGNHNGKINITSNGGSKEVQVYLNVTENPVLSVTPTLLEFGESKINDYFFISNSGSGMITWELSKDQNWIILNTTIGNTTKETDNINVIVDRSELQPGTHIGSVSVVSSVGTKNVQVKISVPESPKLSVNLTSFDFGSNLTSKQMEVRNSGTGLLTWTIAENISWLETNPTRGDTRTETDNVTMTVNREGLTPGTYQGTVVVNSNGGSVTINVTMVVTGVPELYVEPVDLDFGTKEDRKVFRIMNKGQGTLNYSITDNKQWIGVTSQNGSLTTGEVEITVIVNRMYLDPGSYDGLITINSNGGIKIVHVRLIVPETITFEIQPSTLYFSSSVSSKQLEIANSGSGTLSWQASSNVGWMQLNPSSGSVTNGKQIMTVTVDRTGLGAGSHEGIISFTSNAGEKTVSVKMYVSEQPVLSIDRNILDFGLSATSMSFNVRNSGSGTLTWNISSNSSRVSVNPSSGTTTTESDQVNVSIDRDGLAAGSYNAKLTVTSNGGTKEIQILFSVQASAILYISPSTLNFESTLTSMRMNIRNNGGGTLSWNLTPNQNWISVNVTSGSTTSETDQIYVVIYREILDPGDHQGSITVSSNGGTQNVPVLVNVPANPLLAVEPTSLDFGTNETQKTFAIKNTGSGELNWNISNLPPWSTVDRNSGTTTTNYSLVDVTIDRSGLEAGAYERALRIQSNGGEVALPLYMTVAPTEPILSVNISEFNFGLWEDTKYFEITNIGMGVLNWSVSADVDWMSFDPQSGQTTLENDLIQVSGDKSGLTNGKHNATIYIYSDGGNTTISATVSVYNKEDPQLYFEPAGLEFYPGINELQLNITNTGTGTLNWSISPMADDQWVSFNPSSGTTTTEVDVITVVIDRTGLSSGNYLTIPCFDSNGGNYCVLIFLEVP